MKLLVFSDTHGNAQPMLDVLGDKAADANACFLLGDGVRQADDVREAFPELPLYVVRGNCDGGSLEPEEGLAPFGRRLIYYTHGHQLSVKQNLDMLWWRAKRQRADIALYGHTHVPSYTLRDGIHLFNPGSISRPRAGRGSYGCITIENRTPRFDICHLGDA